MKEMLKNFWLKMALIGLCAGAIVFGLTTGRVLAQGTVLAPDDKESYEEHKKKAAEKKLPAHKQPAPAHPGGHKTGGNLAEAATNPVAPMVQFQLQDKLNFEMHNSPLTENVFVFQPVIPIKLHWKTVPVMISRITVPYVYAPVLTLEDPIGRIHGFGDTDALFLLTPTLKNKKMQLGFGGSFSIPTAGSNKVTGSGKWEGGPSFLYINMAVPKLQFGFFGYQMWSFASSSGNSGRPKTSSLSAQPFITAHFKGGWYLGSPETPQVYNWETGKWTWSIGPQGGKVFKIGRRPVKVFGAVYYNPEDNAGVTPEWTFKMGLTLLFPT